jgi:hypothetical protein
MPVPQHAGMLPAPVHDMDPLSGAIRHLSLEDRIEKLARLALVALLFATLSCFV